jgi:circadian clock protein KaiA
MVSSPDSVSRPRISVCTFVKSGQLTDVLDRALGGEHYTNLHLQSSHDFLEAVKHGFSSIDCLVVEPYSDLPQTINCLHQSAILLPAIFLVTEDLGQGQGKLEHLIRSKDVFYHTAEAHLPINELASIPQMIERAIAEFLKLSPQCRLPISETVKADLDFSLSMLQETLSAQQRRLSEKLRERLGYLGVFYKRDSQLFFRNLSKSDREEFLNELKLDYRDIILDYFREGGDINQRIDSFVNKVFFADMSVSQVLEIHMEFMDRLSKKLKLEGRSEDILLDYRLTLIDTIAHLCEMYRRSIPRKPED